MADGCYRYTLTGTDRVGNTASVQSAIVIVDKTAPSVTGVSSSADGSYKAGQVVPTTVTFNEPVTVTGTPTLTSMEHGDAGDDRCELLERQRHKSLTFNYTVAAGKPRCGPGLRQHGSLLGTIRDAATNNATLTLASPGAAGSLGANKNIVIDTTAPTAFSISTTNAGGTAGKPEVNNTIVLTFSELIDPNTLYSGWSTGSTPNITNVTATFDDSTTGGTGLTRTTTP